MSGVTLSSGIAAILNSLQGTTAQVGAVQTRLATGRRVNSALDNAVAYFTARALDARAGDLAALLDGIGQAQQTLTAASQGIAAISRLVQAAKSVAWQAHQAPGPQISYTAITSTGSANAAETLGSVTGSVNVSGAFTANPNGLQIQVGASTYTVNAVANETIGQIINAINTTPGLGAAGAVTAALDGSGTHITLTANNTDTSFQVLTSVAATALGIANTSGSSTNLLQAVGGVSGTALTVQANGKGPKTVNFGAGGGQVSTFAELQNALGGTGVSASLSGGNLTLGVDASLGARNSLALSGSALAPLGLAGGTQYGAVDATDPGAMRVSLQAQYNDLLQQIDTLASDASYGGIALLHGDNLTTRFNETGSSSLTITGVTFDAAGLALTPAAGNDFQSNDVLDSVLGALDAALTTLRTQSATFGSHLTSLQVRQDFTKSLVDTLQTGVDNLVFADTSEQGAELLALQTRQDLSTAALSLAARSDQAVLSLFR